MKRGFREKGSFSLEGALILPVVLAILVMFLAYFRGLEQAAVARHALDQTAKEIELLIPLGDLAGEAAEHGLPQLLPRVPLLKELLIDAGIDIGLSLLSAPALNRRYDTWLQRACRARGIPCPSGDRHFFADYDRSSHRVWLYLEYDRTTYLARGQETLRSSVALWNRTRPSARETTKEDDGIWELGNFERGLRFREMFGANLPLHYPVIAKRDGGEVTSIKSMDLTAPSWRNIETATARIATFMERLAAFHDSEPIESRTLCLIVPRNSPEVFSEMGKQRWYELANTYQIRLDLRFYGTSTRYQSP